jgi:hypothetical protein
MGILDRHYRPRTISIGRGHLPRNLQHVPKAVVMNAAHRGEVVGEGVRLPGFQLLNQELDVGGDKFLFDGRLLIRVEEWRAQREAMHSPNDIRTYFSLSKCLGTLRRMMTLQDEFSPEDRYEEIALTKPLYLID